MESFLTSVSWAIVAASCLMYLITSLYEHVVKVDIIEAVPSADDDDDEADPGWCRVDLTNGRMLGRLDDLAPRNRSLPPIILRPFVALVEPSVSFVPSEEVAATFWVPLARLRHEDSRAEYVMEINGQRASFPAFRVAEHFVWGLTERIVRQLLALVGP